MTRALVVKLLRDVRVPLVVVAILLGGFQCLWSKITQRITEEILPAVTRSLGFEALVGILFKGPGQIIQTLIGGENIDLRHARDVLTVGYVHPLTQTILCVWVIGRAAGAIAGEIDRGTMELLLAQPLARYRLILAHLCVDLVTIPILCLCLWGGTWLGVAIFGEVEAAPTERVETAAAAETGPAEDAENEPAGEVGSLKLNPLYLWPGLVNAAALMFAVSGYTMWLSASGRFRTRVMGLAILVTLVQFLVNVVGQLWDKAAFLRPFTVFYYYEPQPMILRGQWSVDLAQSWQLGHPLMINIIAVLLAVGVVGYALALWTFAERDLPAPL